MARESAGATARELRECLGTVRGASGSGFGRDDRGRELQVQLSEKTCVPIKSVCCRPMASNMELVRGRGLWQWWLAVGSVVAVVYLVLPSENPWTWAVYNVFGFTAAAAIVVGVRRNRPQRRGFWYCFAAALAMWAVGDVVYEVQYFVWGWATFPAPADLPYLLAYPLFGVGAYQLIKGRISGRDRAGFLDAAIVSTSLALLT